MKKLRILALSLCLLSNTAQSEFYPWMNPTPPRNGTCSSGSTLPEITSISMSDYNDVDLLESSLNLPRNTAQSSSPTVMTLLYRLYIKLYNPDYRFRSIGSMHIKDSAPLYADHCHYILDNTSIDLHDAIRQHLTAELLAESLSEQAALFSLPPHKWALVMEQNIALLHQTVMEIIQAEVNNPTKIYLYHAHQSGITLFHDVITAFYRLQLPDMTKKNRVLRYHPSHSYIPSSIDDFFDTLSEGGKRSFGRPNSDDHVEKAQNNTYAADAGTWNDLDPSYMQFNLATNPSLLSKLDYAGKSTLLYWIGNASATKIPSIPLLERFFQDQGATIEQSKDITSRYVSIFKDYGPHSNGVLLQLALNPNTIDDYTHITGSYGTQNPQILFTLPQPTTTDSKNIIYGRSLLESLRINPCLYHHLLMDEEVKLFLHPDVMTDPNKMETSVYFWPPFPHDQLKKYKRLLKRQLKTDLTELGKRK